MQIAFIGDSDHIYLHRAPATKGWLNADPNKILARLRKLGIGVEDCLQQGDFLLKKALKPIDPSEFKHETMGSGHHKFTAPVLYADNGVRHYLVKDEPAMLVHEAVDGIQHPDVEVPVGQWIVGTTAHSLNMTGTRD